MATLEYLVEQGIDSALDTILGKPFVAIDTKGDYRVPRVSPTGNLCVTFGDSAFIDAFGRLRVSSPTALLEIQNQFDGNDLLWDTSLSAGTNSQTHYPNESSVGLETGGSSGDRIVRQYRDYIRYQAARSQLVINTFVFGPGVANKSRYAGYGDDRNGFFVKQNGTNGLQLVKRSYITGSAVDTEVDQANWNIDRFDGTGPSGIVLDQEKVQISWMDIQWLAAGRVRMGFDINGILYPAHQFVHANLITTAYMTTANLPIRFEEVNTGASSSSTTFKAICSAVLSEGGRDILDLPGFPFTTGMFDDDRSIAGASDGLVAIRPKATINGIPNTQKIVIDSIETVAQGEIYYELIYAPDGLSDTGGTYSDVSTLSGLEVNTGNGDYDTSTGTIYKVFGWYGSRRNDSSVLRLDRVPFTTNADGTSTAVLAVVGYGVSGTDTASVQINGREIR